MKLYLFGGAELDMPEVSPVVLQQQIKHVFLDLMPKKILHIPYARLHPTEEEWKEGWFVELMSDTGIEILDARNSDDLLQANGVPLFINGGFDRKILIDSILSNPSLLHVIQHAPFVVSESAGSMIMGEYMTADRSGSEIIKSLGILKNTMIEVHYTQKGRQQLLKNDLLRTGMQYGIGIDCATALVVDPDEFPHHWDKIGVGEVFLMRKDELAKQEKK